MNGKFQAYQKINIFYLEQTAYYGNCPALPMMIEDGKLCEDAVDISVKSSFRVVFSKAMSESLIRLCKNTKCMEFLEFLAVYRNKIYHTYNYIISLFIVALLERLKHNIKKKNNFKIVCHTLESQQKLYYEFVVVVSMILFMFII